MSLRESGKQIKAYDIAYFTASCDTEATNKRFAASLKLDYPILSDPTRVAARAFGVVDDKRTHPRRWTYYIGKNGKILAIEKKVQASSHGTQVLKRLAELNLEKSIQTRTE